MGEQDIFAYKQASWKSDAEVTTDKDSSQVVAGGKESFPVLLKITTLGYDNRVKTVKVLGNSVKQPQSKIVWVYSVNFRNSHNIIADHGFHMGTEENLSL